MWQQEVFLNLLLQLPTCFVRVFMSAMICAWLNKHAVPLDLWTVTYDLVSVVEFRWAVWTEQQARACTNSLGSLAILFNPFHCRLTLMSCARPLQNQPPLQTNTHTQTLAPLSETLPSRACLMTLFWCTQAHPWPMPSGLSRLSSPPHPSSPPYSPLF